MFLLFFLGVNSQNFNIDGIQYIILSKTNTAEVTVGGDYRGDIIIPSQVTNAGVTYSVTSIGEGAFTSSWQLTSVVVPESVNVIHQKAFYKCSGLKQITITEAIDSIGDNAFDNCTSLLSFSIPYSANGTIIGDLAFYNCNKMTSVSLPNSVQSIGSGAFGYCNSLLSFDIPNGITSIKGSTFIWCNSLTSITVPNNVTLIDQNAFSSCSALKTAVIPNSVLTIGYGAFYNCTALSSLTIPASVTVFGMDAFHNCSSLNVIHAEALKPALISSDCFSNYPETCILYVPDNSEADYKNAIGWKDFNVVIGSSTIFYVNGINYRTTAPTEVEVFSRYENYYFSMPLDIPAIVNYSGQNYNVVSIRDSAFSNWKELTKMTLPNMVNTVGNKAFINCTNLNEIITPDAVTSIGNYAFSECSNLGHFFIPFATKTIGQEALNNCTSLDQIWINNADPSEVALGLLVFNNVQKNNCKLFVPIGCKQLYAAADQWKDFKNIAPKPAPSMNKERLFTNNDYDNILEFDYAAYFLTHQDFNFISAFESYLVAVSPKIVSDKIRIYPTMVKESVHISGVEGKSILEIIDIKGNVALTQSIEGDALISLSSLPKAVYIIKITTPERAFAYKIIKS